MTSEEHLKAILVALYLLCLVNGAEIAMLWQVMNG